MPGDILVGLAISVIVIGFLILAGVAIWLAAERRRTLSAAPGRPAPQRASQPAAPQQQPATQPANQGQQAAPQPAAPPTPSAAPAAAPEKASSAAPAAPKAQKDEHSSGEYPSAANYDQTILPEPPRRRTRPRSQ
ncbi:MAG TPA: hypothetical protein VKT82_15995 [Ktedonobacterales bacterium]|nr:hypothetical protein [Ktedonobacterales bacterium]